MLLLRHNHSCITYLQVFQAFLDNRLTILFYCAHISKSHYASFGMLNALDTFSTVLNSPAAHTRLVTRLVICCLRPIMENHHNHLLELTTEEAELLLRYTRQPTLTCGLDLAKLLKAAAVIFQELPQQAALISLVMEFADNVISIVQQETRCDDDCVMEGALCLLWTLCHMPEIKEHITRMDKFVLRLISLQQNPISVVSSLASSVLWLLGCCDFKGKVTTILALPQLTVKMCIIIY